VSGDARLRNLLPGKQAFDPGLLAHARCLVQVEGSIWDIGANVGVFAFAAAGLAGKDGRVLAVEPDPWLFGLLQRSRAANRRRDDLAAVELLCTAVADRPGVARFQIAARGRASNALTGFGNSQMGGVREELLVPTVTLDQLLETTFPPDLVKIDVEGAELLVLQGARRLLAEARPRLLIEVAEPNADAVTTLLRQADYSLFDAADPVRGLPPVHRAVWDTCAIPAERVGVAAAPAHPLDGRLSGRP
jgi:FkbM family methyltransferase